MIHQTSPQATCRPANIPDDITSSLRIQPFWIAFVAMFIYGILLLYISLLLNGFSAFCLASQHAFPSVQDDFTGILGGAGGNEGHLSNTFATPLFILTYAFDGYMSLPIIQQANSFVGTSLSHPFYYFNTWNVILIFCLMASI